MPRSLIDEGPNRSVFEYHSPAGTSGNPTLLVPPLAVPANCFDLRRGCSVVERLVRDGRPTYLVDYGEIAFADRELGLEHWVDDVLPNAITSVSERNDGKPVHLIGWCLGGILSLLTAAELGAARIASITVVASPFDFTKVPLLAPLRPVLNATGGHAFSPLYKVFGGVPAPLVRTAFRISALDKHLTKPISLVRNVANSDALAQFEAVERFTANMVAYPGRAIAQLYHRAFRSNSLADGTITLGGRTVDLARVKSPTLAIGGTDDTLAPPEAVRHVLRLLPEAPVTRFATAPGGHLGVLTGRAARTTTWPLIQAFQSEQDTVCWS
ncbi:alpha/beta fold hydrolase [Herbihabitans rhizosphaerae]|nr:alpha/beta fold hydrolase [Herbihabitans rhizosphaerae]